MYSFILSNNKLKNQNTIAMQYNTITKKQHNRDYTNDIDISYFSLKDIQNAYNI